MKIMVTGVAGFLGSHLADALIAGGHSVIGMDDLSFWAAGRDGEASAAPTSA